MSNPRLELSFDLFFFTKIYFGNSWIFFNKRESSAAGLGWLGRWEERDYLRSSVRWAVKKYGIRQTSMLFVAEFESK